MHYVSLKFSVYIRSWAPARKEKNPSTLKMMDERNDTCFSLTSNNLKAATPVVAILNRKQKEKARETTVTLHGSNLYCDMFSTSCNHLALNVFARSYKDIPLKESCEPLCGDQVVCSLMSTSPTRERCDLKCICPPGGCKEFVLVMNNGILGTSTNLTVCEIELKGE